MSNPAGVGSGGGGGGGALSAFIALPGSAGLGGGGLGARKPDSGTSADGDGLGPSVGGLLRRSSSGTGRYLTVDTRRAGGGLLADGRDGGGGGGGSSSSRLIDGRASGGNAVETGVDDGQQKQAVCYSPRRRRRKIGQAFRPGELECECKYSRRFPLYHRLRANNVLDTLAKYTLEGFRVRGRSGLYVCPDRVGNFFYMTLSEEGGREAVRGSRQEAPSQAAIELKVYGIEDVGEDLKLSLNGRIELALADQGWEALASQLNRNDHLNVTAADWDFVRTGPNADPARHTQSSSKGGMFGSVGRTAAQPSIPLLRGGSGDSGAAGRASQGEIGGRQQSLSGSAGDVSRGSSGSTRVSTKAKGEGEEEEEEQERNKGFSSDGLPGHARAWFSLPADGVLDSYLLLQYLRSVLSADGLMKILHSAATDQQQQQQQQQQQAAGTDAQKPQSPQTPDQPRQPRQPGSPDKEGLGPFQSQLQIDVSFKGGKGHRRRATDSSPLARAYSQ
ncbi:unnamed protein product, partial [Scytosiphon promiscuus]